MSLDSSAPPLAFRALNQRLFSLFAPEKSSNLAQNGSIFGFFVNIGIAPDGRASSPPSYGVGPTMEILLPDMSKHRMPRVVWLKLLRQFF
jgi:hypothetical protein